MRLFNRKSGVRNGPDKKFVRASRKFCDSVKAGKPKRNGKKPFRLVKHSRHNVFRMGQNRIGE